MVGMGLCQERSSGAVCAWQNGPRSRHTGQRGGRCTNLSAWDLGTGLRWFQKGWEQDGSIRATIVGAPMQGHPVSTEERVLHGEMGHRDPRPAETFLGERGPDTDQHSREQTGSHEEGPLGCKDSGDIFTH